MTSVAKERRWILLAETGDHTWLGRHTDPGEDDIGRAEGALRRVGVGGWVAVTEGDYWSKGPMSLLEVRALNIPKKSFMEGVALFLERRTTIINEAS